MTLLEILLKALESNSGFSLDPKPLGRRYISDLSNTEREIKYPFSRKCLWKMHADIKLKAFFLEENVLPFPQDALARLPSLFYFSLFLVTLLSWYRLCHSKCCMTAIYRPGQINPPLAVFHKVSFLLALAYCLVGYPWGGPSVNPSSQLKAQDTTQKDQVCCWLKCRPCSLSLF